MFTKILIANRGEIACRIIKTARKLGIETVAVYSSADESALHVRMADSAMFIGEAPAAESYLLSQRIIDAAIQTGAQAIHPGYGFLAENADFVEACEQAGIVFIGPSSKAIRAMGSKSAAKKLMNDAGVPLTPGYYGDNQDPEFLASEANKIGFPVLVKASAGGGGKGMRRVDSATEFATALQSCKREAKNSFGDDHVLIEKYVLNPRHIEVQIFGDSKGQYVHLFERDCSTQRRYQKVLEEAPAPGITAIQRDKMGAAAINAAKAVNYVGAGTVEFIAQQDGSFYFMEMNTRLQVEHPVTEMVTGEDLVEWQLRIANGEPLPRTQAELGMRGHAIEARIYSENPDNDFLPSTGTLAHLVTPPTSNHIRVDTGVEQGDEITSYYDPMIAKLIAWGTNRESAIAHLTKALKQYQIGGVSNNIEFLAKLVNTDSFTNANLDTDLIEREHTALFTQTKTVPDQVWLVAALYQLLANSSFKGQDKADITSPWYLYDSWRLNSQGSQQFTFEFDDQKQTIDLTPQGEGWTATLNDKQYLVKGKIINNGAIQLNIDGKQIKCSVSTHSGVLYAFYEGISYQLQPLDNLDKGAEAESGEGDLVSPMPGKIIDILVAAGDKVEKGTPLLIMEAMKMEHTLTAPSDGIVKAFIHKVGEQVADGVELIQFDPSEA